ncbi:polysaccharide lyase 8 family protein [Leifsonia poae]|uniref:polysaccharide lyase 8 family protein n=1 Tax=Leifsonia poae TaxID=110933 RepID=UPI001CBE358B|nr:polysaccharide lyase 8 family protein [Leifsonia poae]
MSPTDSAALSRRTVILAGAAAVPVLAAGSALLTATPVHAATAADFALVRTQWLGTLIGDYSLTDATVQNYVTASAAEAQTLWTSLVTTANRTYLWADLNSSSVSAIQRNAIGRLRALALALRSPGSSLYQNAGLKADLLAAVDWFLANKYGVTSMYDNWWDFQIGIPLALNDFCVLLYDDLTASQIATAMTAIKRYAPTPTSTGGATSTGANRNWACSIAILRGALSQDSAIIADAKTAYTTVFPYVSGGDGFYTDGGFIQHKYFSYNGGYAVSLLQYLTYSMVATAGTPWAFTAPRVAEVYDWVQHNYAPWIYAGAFMDMTRGRGLSRFYETDHRVGRLTIATLLQLAAVFPAAQALTVRAQCKGWIDADAFLPFFTYDKAPIEQVRLASIVQGRAVMADAGIAAAAESTQTVVATSMARAVHRRPAFPYAVAMDSTVIKPYESANNENLQGWYTGEGAVYLYLPGQTGQWANQYWPTADKYRIPGTTVDTKTLALGAGRGSANTWTGGALLDGDAALGMSLKFAVQTLTGRKSWFCLDDVIACLGAGISSTDGTTIESIVENRNIGPNGQTIPVVDGAAVLATPGSSPSTLHPNWAWIPNTGGYVFPGGTTIKAMREDRTGKWTDMDHRGVYDDTTTYSRRFVTFWFDHGVSPSNAGYAYLQLPGATQAQTAGMAASTEVAVVANTAEVQAVTRAGTGTTMANFWTAGAPKTAGIQLDNRASVVVTRTGGRLSIAVSDPTQVVAGAVTVTIDGPATGVVQADPGVTVLALTPNVKLSVDVTGAAGASFVARFSV